MSHQVIKTLLNNNKILFYKVSIRLLHFVDGTINLEVKFFANNLQKFTLNDKIIISINTLCC